MSTTTSGYELRSNLLHLAKNILSDRMHAALQNPSVLPDGEKPTLLSAEAVIEEAKKLYSFVTTK